MKHGTSSIALLVIAFLSVSAAPIDIRDDTEVTETGSWEYGAPEENIEAPAENTELQAVAGEPSVFDERAVLPHECAPLPGTTIVGVPAPVAPRPTTTTVLGVAPAAPRPTTTTILGAPAPVIAPRPMPVPVPVPAPAPAPVPVPVPVAVPHHDDDDATKAVPKVVERMPLIKMD
ncbi:hypothetical protein LA080_012559 [Diaporthe eres]|nr:hypothetical protein LA080_012559 [Diaporthe eres]